VPGVLDRQKVAALVERAARDVDEGLLPSCQLAIARDGEVELFETLGDATPSTRYVIFSCTKAIVASAAWLLIGDGLLDVAAPVVDLFPEFGANGKSAVTVEQVMLHTCGFPRAPMRLDLAADRQARIERMASWRLSWEPGSRYEYHPSSAHWVLAELIERAAGMDFRDFIHSRITGPLGLGRIVGVPAGEQDGIAVLQVVGDPVDPDELEAIFGVRELDLGEVTDENLLRFNQPEVRALGVPGAGGITTAAGLALFYQALLHDRLGLWKPDVLADATGHVRIMLPDPRLGTPAWRTLGLVIAGDDGGASRRAFGKTNSPLAFGHGGAHGQVGWADPATGISFAYCTNGMDRNVLREARRIVGLSSRAGVCAG
jgi:CubicO group peptidase (beta-lactamase class C family)